MKTVLLSSFRSFRWISINLTTASKRWRWWRKETESTTYHHKHAYNNDLSKSLFFFTFLAPFFLLFKREEKILISKRNNQEGFVIYSALSQSLQHSRQIKISIIYAYVCVIVVQILVWSNKERVHEKSVLFIIRFWFRVLFVFPSVSFCSFVLSTEGVRKEAKENSLGATRNAIKKREWRW